MATRPCRECRREVSEQATACPGCGAPWPSKPRWDGYGFEYRSKAAILGLPLLHVSFKYRPNRAPVVARGVIAIGQFAVGGLTISQFGIGLVSVSQFTVAGFALAQFAVGWSLVAQIGLFLHDGRGQLVRGVGELLGLLR
jgi:hypothetical protein